MLKQKIQHQRWRSSDESIECVSGTVLARHHLRLPHASIPLRYDETRNIKHYLSSPPFSKHSGLVPTCSVCERGNVPFYQYLFTRGFETSLLHMVMNGVAQMYVNYLTLSLALGTLAPGLGFKLLV